jgi:DNA-binding FadR family transcriptional regulator
MSLLTEPIVRRMLSDKVFARLKQLMTSGRELMQRFSVGRPAIREAVQALAGMGLVAISHGERGMVRDAAASSVQGSCSWPRRFTLRARPARRRAKDIFHRRAEPCQRRLRPQIMRKPASDPLSRRG